jgi:hypothetical protein
MLAVAHAADLSAAACEFDNRRTVCPEDWEMRQLSILEATAKPLDWHQRIGVDGLDIPKRILYIDSEGWFIFRSVFCDGQRSLPSSQKSRKSSLDFASSSRA